MGRGGNSIILGFGHFWELRLCTLDLNNNEKKLAASRDGGITKFLMKLGSYVIITSVIISIIEIKLYRKYARILIPHTVLPHIVSALE